MSGFKKGVDNQNYKHGYRSLPIYSVWCTMKARCYNPNSMKFPLYGGRGVAVCDEWLDPKAFCEWALATGYERGLTIDRIDNDGDYEPSNCRFITTEENNQNRRCTILTPDDVKKIKRMIRREIPQVRIAERFNVSPANIYNIKADRAWKNVEA